MSTRSHHAQHSHAASPPAAPSQAQPPPPQQQQQQAASSGSTPPSRTRRGRRNNKQGNWKPYSQLTWVERKALEQSSAQRRERGESSSRNGVVIPQAPIITSTALMDERERRTAIPALDDAEAAELGLADELAEAEADPLGLLPEPVAERSSSTTGGKRRGTAAEPAQQQQQQPNAKRAASSMAGGSSPTAAANQGRQHKPQAKLETLLSQFHHPTPADQQRFGKLVGPERERLALPWAVDDRTPVDLRSLSFDDMVTHLNRAALLCRLLSNALASAAES
jgi:hypothetical protein